MGIPDFGMVNTALLVLVLTWMYLSSLSPKPVVSMGVVSRTYSVSRDGSPKM